MQVRSAARNTMRCCLQWDPQWPATCKPLLGETQKQNCLGLVSAKLLMITVTFLLCSCYHWCSFLNSLHHRCRIVNGIKFMGACSNDQDDPESTADPWPREQQTGLWNWDIFHWLEMESMGFAWERLTKPDVYRWFRSKTVIYKLYRHGSTPRLSKCRGPSESPAESP